MQTTSALYDTAGPFPNTVKWSGDDWIAVACNTSIQLTVGTLPILLFLHVAPDSCSAHRLLRRVLSRRFVAPPWRLRPQIHRLPVETS